VKNCRPWDGLSPWSPTRRRGLGWRAPGVVVCSLIAGVVVVPAARPGERRGWYVRRAVARARETRARRWGVVPDWTHQLGRVGRRTRRFFEAVVLVSPVVVVPV